MNLRKLARKYKAEAGTNMGTHVATHSFLRQGVRVTKGERREVYYRKGPGDSNSIHSGYDVVRYSHEVALLYKNRDEFNKDWKDTYGGYELDPDVE